MAELGDKLYFKRIDFIADDGPEDDDIVTLDDLKRMRASQGMEIDDMPKQIPSSQASRPIDDHYRITARHLVWIRDFFADQALAARTAIATPAAPAAPSVPTHVVVDIKATDAAQVPVVVSAPALAPAAPHIVIDIKEADAANARTRRVP